MSSLPALSILSSTFFFLLPVLKLVLVCSAYSTSRQTTRRPEWCYMCISLLAVLSTLEGTFELLSIKNTAYMRVAAKICRVLLELVAGLCAMVLIVLSTPRTTVPRMSLAIYMTVLAILQFCGVLLSLLNVSQLLGPLFYLLFATAALPLLVYVFLIPPPSSSTRVIVREASATPSQDESSAARSFTTLPALSSPSNMHKKAISLDLPSSYRHSIVLPVNQRVSLDNLKQARISTEEHTFVLTPGSRAFGFLPDTAPIQSGPDRMRSNSRPAPLALHRSYDDVITALHPRILWTLILLSQIAVLLASSLEICGYVLKNSPISPQTDGTFGSLLNRPTYSTLPIFNIGIPGVVERPWQVYSSVHDSAEKGKVNTINNFDVLVTADLEFGTAFLVFKTLSDVCLVLAVACLMCAYLACTYVDVPGPVPHTHPIAVSTQTHVTETLDLEVISHAAFNTSADADAAKDLKPDCTFSLPSPFDTESNTSVSLGSAPHSHTRCSTFPYSSRQSKDTRNTKDFDMQTKYNSYNIRALVDFEDPKDFEDMFTPLPQRRRDRSSIGSSSASPGSSTRRCDKRVDNTCILNEAAIATMDVTQDASGASPRLRLQPLSRMSLPRHLRKFSLTKSDGANDTAFSRSLSLPLSDVGTHIDDQSLGASLSRSSSFASPRPKQRPVQTMHGGSTMSMIDLASTQHINGETEDVLAAVDENDDAAWRKTSHRMSITTPGLGLKSSDSNMAPSPYLVDDFGLVSPCPAYSDDETSIRDSSYIAKPSIATAIPPTPSSRSKSNLKTPATQPPSRPPRSPTFHFLPNFPSLKLSQVKSSDVKKSPRWKGGDTIRMSALSVSSSTPIFGAWAAENGSPSARFITGDKITQEHADFEEVPLGEEGEGSDQEVFQTPSKKIFRHAFSSSSPTKSINVPLKSSPSTPSRPSVKIVSKSPSPYSSPSFYSNPSLADQSQVINLASKSSSSILSSKISPSKHSLPSQSRPPMRPSMLRKPSAKYDHGYTPFGGYDPDPFAAPEPGALVRDSGVEALELPGQGQTRMSAWGTLTLPVPTPKSGSLTKGTGTAKRAVAALKRSPTTPSLAPAARAGNSSSTDLDARPRLKSGPSAHQGRRQVRDAGAGQNEPGGSGRVESNLADSLPVEEALLAQRLLKRLNRRAERGGAGRKPGQGGKETERTKDSGVGRSFLLSMVGNGTSPSKPF